VYVKNSAFSFSFKFERRSSVTFTRYPTWPVLRMIDRSSFFRIFPDKYAIIWIWLCVLLGFS